MVAPAGRRSIFRMGPGRRALVIFPFDAARNAWFKDLGPKRVEFGGDAKGWAVKADTDHEVEALLRKLLKLFDVLLLEDASRVALLGYRSPTPPLMDVEQPGLREGPRRT